MAEAQTGEAGGHPTMMTFDRSLYSEAAVRAAVAAFEGFATLTVAEEGVGWTVCLTEPDPRHADVLADELANYALSESVALAREGEPA